MTPRTLCVTLPSNLIIMTEVVTENDSASVQKSDKGKDDDGAGDVSLSETAKVNAEVNVESSTEVDSNIEPTAADSAETTKDDQAMIVSDPVDSREIASSQEAVDTSVNDESTGVSLSDTPDDKDSPQTALTAPVPDDDDGDNDGNTSQDVASVKSVSEPHSVDDGETDGETEWVVSSEDDTKSQQTGLTELLPTTLDINNDSEQPSTFEMTNDSEISLTNSPSKQITTLNEPVPVETDPTTQTPKSSTPKTDPTTQTPKDEGEQKSPKTALTGPVPDDSDDDFT